LQLAEIENYFFSLGQSGGMSRFDSIRVLQAFAASRRPVLFRFCHDAAVMQLVVVSRTKKREK
jgi:hypothetical protein